MPVVPNNVDWSATAAWIALVVAILSPAITAYFTNQHQLKLRKIDIEEKAIDVYEKHRFETISTFLSQAGRFLSHPNTANMDNFGERFHSIYQFVPESSWQSYDEFYNLCISSNYVEARKRFLTISHELNAILKESHQLPALK